MRLSPATLPSLMSVSRLRASQRHRQWARYSGRSASEISQEIGARSHHDHACTREANSIRNPIRLGRLAWGRHFRRQRAVGTPRSGSRAEPDALPADLRAGSSQNRARKLGKVQNRRGTSVRFKPDEKIFGKGAHFKPARLFKMARAKAYLFRRRRDPLALRRRNGSIRTRAFRPRRFFRFPGGLKDCLSPGYRRQRPHHRPDFRGARSQHPAATDRSNGHWPGSPMTMASSIPTATRSHPRRREPMKPASRRPNTRPQGSRRTDRSGKTRRSH